MGRHHHTGSVVHRYCAGTAAEEHVDDGIADDLDALRCDPFPGEELRRERSGREVQRGKATGHAPVDLLQRRRVVRTQARLHVRDRNREPPRGEAERRNRVRVAEHDHRVGPPVAHQVDRPLENRSHPVRRAAFEVPTYVGPESEIVEEGVREGGVVVLAGRDDFGLDAACAHRGHNRRQLDDLGAGPERHQHSHRIRLIRGSAPRSTGPCAPRSGTAGARGVPACRAGRAGIRRAGRRPLRATAAARRRSAGSPR